MKLTIVLDLDDEIVQRVRENGGELYGVLSTDWEIQQAHKHIKSDGVCVDILFGVPLEAIENDRLKTNVDQG